MNDLFRVLVGLRVWFVTLLPVGLLFAALVAAPLSVDADSKNTAKKTKEAKAPTRVPTAKKTDKSAGCDIRKIDWKNLKYGEEYTLKGGEAHWESDTEEHSISLADVKYADLDGNGKPEAYVWVTDWKDWGEMGTEGSEDLYVYTVDAKCRPRLLAKAQYFTDTSPGKFVGKRYVVQDFDKKYAWFFKDGKLTKVESPLSEQ